MNVMNEPGCSSLLLPNKKVKEVYSDIESCTTVKRKINVKVAPLKEILKSLPFVNLMKIDVQGKDLEVFQSGRDEIYKVGDVLMEVQNLNDGTEKETKMLVNGGETKMYVVQEMDKLGFQLKKCFLQDQILGEENCWFRNTRWNISSRSSLSNVKALNILKAIR